MRDPSTELAALLARLRRAIAPAVALTIPLGCTSGESSSSKRADAKLIEGSEKTEGRERGDGRRGGEEHGDTREAGDEGPPREPNFPRCPSGQWCGTKALAEPLRRTDEYAKDIADLAGCPGALHGRKLELDPAVESPYADMPLSQATYATLDVEATQARRSAGDEDTCCYEWMEQCPGGRPLLEDGRPQLARLRPVMRSRGSGPSWTARLAGLDRKAIVRLPAATRWALAEAWLADALLEHSSIASFVRARRELEAVDAPIELIRGCARAALDERRHARLCFGIAAAYGAPAVEPEALAERPARPGGLARVAVDTFIEGCVGETVAAACVQRAAAEARDPALGRLLARIGHDEAEHAALAWRTLAWAFARGGQPVREAVLAAASTLRPSPSDAAALPESEAELELGFAPGHGRLAARTRAALRREVWATIIDPLSRSSVRMTSSMCSTRPRA